MMAVGASKSGGRSGYRGVAEADARDTQGRVRALPEWIVRSETGLVQVRDREDEVAQRRALEGSRRCGVEGKSYSSHLEGRTPR